MEKIIFSKKEQESILKSLAWRIDECDSILCDSSLSDVNRKNVERTRDYWCGIIRKLNFVFNISF